MYNSRWTKFGRDELEFSVTDMLEEAGLIDVAARLGNTTVTVPSAFNKDKNHEVPLRLDYAFASQPAMSNIKGIEVIKKRCNRCYLGSLSDFSFSSFRPTRIKSAYDMAFLTPKSSISHNKKWAEVRYSACVNPTMLKLGIMASKQSMNKKAHQPALQMLKLGIMIGTWKMSGRNLSTGEELHGQTTFSWLGGNSFMIKQVEVDSLRGLEVIGYNSSIDRCTSFYFDSRGRALTFAYDVDVTSITVTPTGSVADVSSVQLDVPPDVAPAFKGTFSADGNTITGPWKGSGGTSFEAVMRRVK